MSIESGNNFRPPEEKAPTKIGEIKPIEESRNTIVQSREQLKELVEGPLLSACEELYDKNIRTLSTSANKKDIQYGTAHLIVDFDSLSEENKGIGEQLGEIHRADKMNQLVINIPLTEQSTASEVKEFAESVAHKFKNQPMTWAPTYTLEQMRQIYGIDPNDETYDVEAFADQFYYDPEKKLFYPSEELAQKSK